MKYAADFRKDARKVLKGRWGTTVIAGLIAALVGAATSGSPKINFEFDENHIESGI